MSIGISDEHVELAASLRKWAADLRGRELARQAETDADATFGDVWAASLEMGIATIAVPEGAGGGGGTVLDLAVALEACAHELVPGPLLGPAVASLVVPDLPADAVVAVGLTDVVWDVPSATHFLLTDPSGGWSLYPRDAVEASSSVGLDLSRRYGSVRVVDRAAGVAVPDLTDGLLRRTTVTLAAAEAAGVARWCLATAVEYAKVREQFGQKIGAFQAIKHLCAEMLETAEAVTAAAWDVACVCAADPEERDDEQWAFAVDVAAAVVFDGAVEVAKSCIQVLGGIGFTFEHDAHLYLRRALGLRALVGDSDAAAERLTAAAVAGTRRRVHLDLDGRDEAIRDEIRATVERIAALPADERRAAFVETGYLTPHWPSPYGLGADAVTQVVLDQELARAELTRPDIVIAGWAVPTILEHGTDAQRERFVRPSLLADITWCQLFSEPGAGSDLASLRTKATKVDGGWRLTGQKVWNSVAERADWGICLARTNPDVPKHKGISYFLVDMKNSDGIDVRPLREITGKALFNEVFLDDVFVPDDLVVGEVDDGWKLARTTLANERVAMATARLSKSTERAIELATGASAAQRVAVGHSIALATVCALLGVRGTMRSLAGQGPGAESSVAKLLGVRNRQDGAELVVALHGDAVLLDAADDVRADVWEMLNTRCLSIAGGTTQILRNVAGERILGLPR
ncbi:acyl-CoA dehydrogenase [Nocardioides sp. Root1257]|uniref:acyl-CoA dehydrogenase n=1 Tax=unclassified Nocardioides TaxID=2615069 RepID=UPI0006FA8CD4|nr:MULTISPECIES: acyl-CoA dehydrogenase [unclassified Nocardioides]KQW53081.1 acyl-CoA dehydrogenase [Nocardioides sp. Root1257]KRC55769.1 acyl-CoA dehydrogenase [Nocardioides sp. Root224]